MPAANAKKTNTTNNASQAKPEKMAFKKSAEIIEMTIHQHEEASAEIKPEDHLEGDRDFEAFMSRYNMRDEFA